MSKVDERSDRQLIKAARQSRNFARWRWFFTALTILVSAFFVYAIRHASGKDSKGPLCFILLVAAILTGATAFVGWVYRWRPLSSKRVGSAGEDDAGLIEPNVNRT